MNIQSELRDAMPKVIETTVYQYDELSDEAKAKAREGFEEASLGDDWFTRTVIDDAVRMGEMLGIDFTTHEVELIGGSKRCDPNIYWNGFYCLGEGAAFEGRYHYVPDAVEKIKEETGGTDKVLLAIAYSLEGLNKLISENAVVHVDSRSSDSSDMAFTFEAFDENEEEIELPEGYEDGVSQALRDFADWIFGNLKSEHEYTFSEEQIVETIRANEYEFTADGELF